VLVSAPERVALDRAADRIRPKIANATCFDLERLWYATDDAFDRWCVLYVIAVRLQYRLP
jgi:hypothetical protein